MIAKMATMASSSDYRKPRNRELHDLTRDLPYPLRIKDPKGTLLWQNRAAEKLVVDGSWTLTPVSWQNKNATLETLSVAPPERPDSNEKDLEKDLKRARKQQRSTARKKRQAELALSKAENRLEDALKTEAKLREQIAKLERESEERKAQFQQFQEEVAEQDADRRLQDELREKVAEFERLERLLEEEQRAFAQEKGDLQEKLETQEQEFSKLKEGFEAKAQEPTAVPVEEFEELKSRFATLTEKFEHLNEELAKANDELKAAQADKGESSDRERRLAGQIETLKQSLVKGREKEQEYRETLNLYSELRGQTNHLRQQLASHRAAERGWRQRAEAAIAELAEHKAAPPPQPPPPAPVQPAVSVVSSQSLSVAARNELEFVKKRLSDTEKKLDEALSQLRNEKAQNEKNREAERLAFQDRITGLPNLNMVDRYLQYAHEKAQSSGRALALFYIDFDDFRVFNTTYGREWGDALLKAVAERLDGMRGQGHLVARHSLDRFVLLATDLDRQSAPQFVQQAARSLRDAISYPFEIRGETVKISACLGVTLGPLPGDHSRGLYGQAEWALQAAKEQGAGRYAFFDENLKQKRLQETTYAKQMAQAVEKDEFKAVFQPVVELRKGQVMGLELLTRWEHRDLKVLEPKEFLEPAIKSGLIFEIGQRIWPQSFRMLNRWQRLRKGLTLSINLCDKELLSPNLAGKAREWALQAGVDPSTIIFEVRDGSALRRAPSWWDLLHGFVEAGFRFCLDDYGSEESILGTLAFPGFVQAKVWVDEKNPYLLPSVEGAKRVEYVAMGIQARYDKRGLLKAGFDLAQGYAVSRPIEGADVEDILS